MNLNKSSIGQKFQLKIGGSLVHVIYAGSEFRAGVIKYKFDSELCPNFTFYFTASEFDKIVIKKSA